MNFVKVGKIYVNPALVARVKNVYPEINEPAVVKIEMSDNNHILLQDTTIEEVVGLLNEGL